MKRRIAMVSACPFPVPQGSQVLLQNAAEALAQTGHEVHLVVYGYGSQEYSGHVPIHRCPLIPVARKTSAGPSIWKPLLDSMLARTLRHVVHQYDVQIVHAHNYEGLLVALAAGRRPIVYHAHNVMADELPHFVFPASVARGIGGWLDRTFPRRADAVIALHNPMKSYLAESGCREDRITVIPPPVAPFPGDSQADSGMPSVVYFGNADAYQNLGLLEKAAAHVRSTRPDARFIIATHTNLDVRWAQVIKVRNWAEAAALLSRDVIVACPRTSWSGFPIKVLNAMAAGLPVVACSSAAHGIEHDVTGFAVRDNDPLEFASAILHLMHDAPLRRSIGNAAREWIARNASFEAVSVAIERVYDSLLGDGIPQAQAPEHTKQNA